MKQQGVKAGAILGGRFELVEQAGAGGMGTVWRGIDRDSGTAAAIKVLGALADESLRSRFEREVRLLGELAHPGIVRPLASGATDEGTPWLAMDWLSGEDLAAHLARGPLGVADAVALVERVSAALGHAHTRAVVHRDVKPANLFLLGGRTDDVRVLDFGIAHVVDDTGSTTRTGAMLGTPSYMAPEQVKGEAVDPRTDVFALGAVLYECISGRQAFGGVSHVAVLARILLDEPPALDHVAPACGRSVSVLCGRMLSKEPRARPADGREVAAELAAIAASIATDKPAPAAAAMGRLEQRMCSIVLAPETVDPDQTLRTRPAGAETPHGARRVRMRDGTTAMLFEGASAPELAARAARAALELKRDDQDATVAVATGRAATLGRLPAGEAIDRAAELARRKSTGVRLDELTAGLLGERFDVGADEGGLVLRGANAREPDERTLLGKPAPFFGRAQEMAMLEGLVLGAAEEGSARAAVLTGPAGIGKSRLRQELVRAVRARHPDLQVWMGRSDPSREGSPFAVLSQAIAGAAGLADGAPLETRRRQIRAFVERSVPSAEQGRVAEFIGEMCRVPFPDEHGLELRTARADPRLMGDQVRRAVEDLVDAECATGPLLLVLEDLQWGDPPTVELLDRMLRNLAERPLVVLALARPELDARFPRLWADRRLITLPLGPLGAKAAEKVARQILGADAPAERVRSLIVRAEGNAFFLEELVRAASEGRWEEAPGTVLAMMQSRLEALEPAARRLLRAASVLGDTFWAGAASALLDAPEEETDRWLEQLESRELVSAVARTRFPGEREWTFRHAIVREAAYAMLTEEDRSLGHRLAGQWLERHGEPDALVVATHLERGGDRETAALRWVRAAEQALEASDLRGATERASHAVGLGATGGARGTAWLVAAEAHYWLGENADAARRAAEAVGDLPRGEARFFTATWLVAVANGRLGVVEAVESAAAELMRTPASPGAELARLSALALTAARLLVIDRVELALPLIRAVEAEPEAEAPLVAAALATALTELEWSRGNPEAQLAQIEVAVREYARAGDRRRACLFQGNLGYAMSELGLTEEAVQTLEASLAEAEQLGLLQVAAAQRMVLGNAYAMVGRLVEARTLLRGAASDLREQRDPRLEGGARLFLAWVLLKLGDLEEAEREARAAIDLRAMVASQLPWSHATLAEVHLAAGRLDEARAAASEGMRVAADHVAHHEALVRSVWAQVLLASGDREGARAAIREARDQLVTQADRIRSSERRARFLAIAENTEILALARELVDDAAGA